MSKQNEDPIVDEFDKVEFDDDRVKKVAKEIAQAVKNDTFDTAALAAAKEVAELVIRKQRDYGPGNILNSVVDPKVAIAVRLTDKIARLVNLSEKGVNPENEALTDTAMDIMGYGLVLYMVLSGTFTLPLEEK